MQNGEGEKVCCEEEGPYDLEDRAYEEWRERKLFGEELSKSTCRESAWTNLHIGAEMNRGPDD